MICCFANRILFTILLLAFFFPPILTFKQNRTKTKLYTKIQLQESPSVPVRFFNLHCANWITLKIVVDSGFNGTFREAAFGSYHYRRWWNAATHLHLCRLSHKLLINTSSVWISLSPTPCREQNANVFNIKSRSLQSLQSFHVMWLLTMKWPVTGSAIMASFWKVLAWTSSSSSFLSFPPGSSSSSSSKLWKTGRERDI